MRSSGKTIAVLGCGVDYIYPKENKEIYKRIIESGGVIVSEYEEGTQPDSEKFRQRNRIVSGLSLGVLIVEAEARSGTSITARFAREQGKFVFCIPNSIDNRKGIGTNNLIKKGATLVQMPSDVMEKYRTVEKKNITIEELDKKNKITPIKLNQVPEEYKKIYEILYEPLSINEISIRTKLDITEVYSKLFLMELEGLVKRQGNKYIIV